MTASQAETLCHLLAEICADPAGDMSRLVYADFLEESGIDPDRAEFIRVQVELAKPAPKGRPRPCCHKPHPAISFCPECRALRRRERELFSEDAIGRFLPREFHSRITLGSVADWPGTIAAVRRGFVAEIRCTADAWLAHGPAVCACQPVEGVVLGGKIPSQFFDNDDRTWCWEPGLQFDNSNQIPFDVAKYLTVKPSFIMGGLMVYRYPTREAALEDLSAASLRWALAEAGVTRGGGKKPCVKK